MKFSIAVYIYWIAILKRGSDVYTHRGEQETTEADDWFLVIMCL